MRERFRRQAWPRPTPITRIKDVLNLTFKNGPYKGVLRFEWSGGDMDHHIRRIVKSPGGAPNRIHFPNYTPVHSSFVLFFSLRLGLPPLQRSRFARMI